MIARSPQQQLAARAPIGHLAQRWPSALLLLLSLRLGSIADQPKLQQGLCCPCCAAWRCQTAHCAVLLPQPRAPSHAAAGQESWSQTGSASDGTQLATRAATAAPPSPGMEDDCASILQRQSSTRDAEHLQVTVSSRGRSNSYSRGCGGRHSSSCGSSSCHHSSSSSSSSSDVRRCPPTALAHAAIRLVPRTVLDLI